MKITIDNIHYANQDYVNCICADITREDNSKGSTLAHVRAGRLDESGLAGVFTEEEVLKIFDAFKSFISENPTPEFEYSWRPANGNGELSGLVCNQSEIDQALVNFKTELLAGCANDEDREGILNGTFVITHPVVADEVRPLR